MKKKFIILTLCFTIVFSSINYKKSYALDPVITPTMIAVLGAVAIGSGIAIVGTDDIVDLGRMFYDYVNTYNQTIGMTWDIFKSTFATSVKLKGDKVYVGGNIIEVIKGFFDNTFTSSNADIGSISFVNNFPVVPYSTSDSVNNVIIPKYGLKVTKATIDTGSFTLNGFDFVRSSTSTSSYGYKMSLNGTVLASISLMRNKDHSFASMYRPVGGSTPSGMSGYQIVVSEGLYGANFSLSFVGGLNGAYDFPYSGGYEWDDSKKDELTGDLPLGIPGNLGDLVGGSKDNVWENGWTNGNVNTQNPGVTMPDVSNPSIGVGGETTFPNDTTVPDVDNPSVPSEGIWADIKAFIINLVVPSDTFWTDTFNQFFNNFNNSFPLVDMDKFNDLVVGEKKFPNIDVTIMGSKGRIVNGDTVNSIVDWLRPIIAGFMMLCLMLFNYRKIYKLIRNSEPFQGVAMGSSDFSTNLGKIVQIEQYQPTEKGGR